MVHESGEKDASDRSRSAAGKTWDSLRAINMRDDVYTRTRTHTHNPCNRNFGSGSVSADARAFGLVGLVANSDGVDYSTSVSGEVDRLVYARADNVINWPSWCARARGIPADLMAAR